MFTLKQRETFTQDIRKSRFIAHAAPVASEDEAKAFIAAVSDASANHNCWAWRIGQAYRFSDDGEPSGTAGKPILQAIDGQALDGVAAVVTRFFGGILLGSGGLVRAYGGTAAICLKAAEKVEIIPRSLVRFGCGFSDLALVKSRLLGVCDLHIEKEEFGAEGAWLDVAVPVAEVEAVIRMVTDLTSGRALIDTGD
ncbi:YigZ family protein [Rhizobium cremeum]|uniref:IMPACT family protein n=1 Tax=Rhizobium cremeum TaxID=2813827 RepID=UPI000DE11A98|nr:YigZ family protein [Rhizobium cremeum]MCJ7995259.1 YigZ family protein [Rhizobium cremeum]MCJ8000429.1 YigZ family protein [Rhizobium cremeum]